VTYKQGQNQTLSTKRSLNQTLLTLRNFEK
jgi:hypothetical protein